MATSGISKLDKKNVLAHEEIQVLSFENVLMHLF